MNMTTDEQENAANHILHGNGFTRLREIISPDEASTIRDDLLQKTDAAREMGTGVLGITDLVTAGPEFIELVTHPRLLAVAHALLGADATLGAFSARILMPGCEEGKLHVDYPYWAMNPGMPVAPAMMMQVIWMMEPFSEENGGTWVAPGSQQWPTPTDPTRFAGHAVQATGNAGDAIISHGLLWHRTAHNHSQQPRVAILINYTQLAIRPMVQMGPFSEEFQERASPELRRLLAFDQAAALRARLAY